MPKEHKKRGRRAEEKKRKHEDQHEDEAEPKRPRVSAEDVLPAEHVDMVEGEQSYNQEGQALPNPDDAKYFGMLDEEEQEYFKRADDMLEANQFQDDEDRSNFLASVYKEAEGKELKMACSQGCSRLTERLIQTSTTGQLKTLFQKFSSKLVSMPVEYPLLTGTIASSTLSNIDLPPTAASLSSYKLHHASLQSSIQLPNARTQTTQMKSLCQWRICSSLQFASWTIT